jgi:hypothetical protein
MTDATAGEASARASTAARREDGLIAVRLAANTVRTEVKSSSNALQPREYRRRQKSHSGNRADVFAGRSGAEVPVGRVVVL